MMPARRPQGDAGGPVLDAMLTYASYGFSVIPILPGSKKPFGALLPEGQWRKYQKAPATPEEIERWVDQKPDTGVGIVCGSVSSNLVCLDIDDQEFSTYVEGILDELVEGGAWVQRSGSGLLHVFLKTAEKVITSQVIGGGRKLADIRGDGANGRGPSYMVAAPSIHETTKKPYEDLGGDPKHVREVVNANRVFDRLRDRFSGVPSGAVIVVPDTGVDLSDQRILSPASDEEHAWIVNEIKREFRLSRKVAEALTLGSEAGEGKWASAPSNSELDHHVIRELRACGWDVDKIEKAFAWTPVGNHRYRTHKGTHGRAYILTSINSIDSQERRMAEAASKAEGSNFRIDKVVRVGFEAAPVFELTITLTEEPQRVGLARLDIEDLMDEHRFCRAVGRSLNFFPRVDQEALGGRKFRKFGDLVLRMSKEEPVPQSATVGGHLRATILAFVLEETAPFEPEDYRQITLGWRAEGIAYVRGGALLQRLQNVIYPKPKPEEVWQTMRGMGSEEVGHKWKDGRLEAVWAMPVGHRSGDTRTNGTA